MNHIENSYNVKLQRLVRELRADINTTLVPVIKQYAPEYVQDGALSVDAAPTTPVLTHDGWADAIRNALDALLARWVTSPLAKAAAAVIAGDFVRTSLQYTDRRIKRTTGIDVFASDRRLDEYIKAATNQNARLITSIPEQYLGQVANIVEGNMRVGMRPSYIEKALTQQFGVTQRRARLIARDQTSKVTGEMNKQRQVNAGFEYFRWRDSSDSRVRERHHEIATAETPFGIGVYRWTDLPKSDKGEPIQPGSDYQCRCVAIPVSEAKVKQWQEKKKGR